MHDEDGPKAPPAAADDEQAEALSRAAREAVRQPADPRLEKSFAKLGLFTDEEPTTVPAPDAPERVTPAAALAPERVTPTAPAAADASVGLDATTVPAATQGEPIESQLAALRDAVGRVERRLGMIASLLIGLSVVVTVLAVLLVLRAVA